jgi:hypothetical protein
MKEKTIKQRWNGKTPKFWKRVQRWAIITGAVAGAIIAAPVTLPVGVITAATYIAAVSATVATTSQLTIEDGNTQEGQ